MKMSSQTKIALGSVLATIGPLVMVLSLLLGWYSNPSPWVFPLGFAAGLVAGIGTALGVGGLVERRRER
jgi:hypothetical protein